MHLLIHLNILQRVSQNLLIFVNILTFIPIINFLGTIRHTLILIKIKSFFFKLWRQFILNGHLCTKTKRLCNFIEIWRYILYINIYIVIHIFIYIILYIHNYIYIYFSLQLARGLYIYPRNVIHCLNFFIFTDSKNWNMIETIFHI